MRYCLPLVFALSALALQAAEPTLLDRGFRQMYNLEFDAAHQTFAAWEQQNPDDPLGPVADAAGYLFAEFDRLHILEAEFFTDDSNFRTTKKLVPSAAVKTRFEQRLSKGQELAQRVLARTPHDENALFATVLRLGLHSDYLALIEKRYLASLADMKEGRGYAEQLLAICPKCYDAYLAIGVENYMLSLKPAPVRWLLRLGGARTDKDQGVQTLTLTAEHGRYLLPFARLLLAVAALRDGNRARARDLLDGLAREFPKNPLYAQELARLR